MKHTMFAWGEILLIGALVAAPALAQNPAPEAPAAQPMTAPGQDTSAAPPASQSGQHHRHNHARHGHHKHSASQPSVGAESNPAAAGNAGAGPNPAGPDAPPAPGGQ